MEEKLDDGTLKRFVTGTHRLIEAISFCAVHTLQLAEALGVKNPIAIKKINELHDRGLPELRAAQNVFRKVEKLEMPASIRQLLDNVMSDNDKLILHIITMRDLVSGAINEKVREKVKTALREHSR